MKLNRLYFTVFIFQLFFFETIAQRDIKFDKITVDNGLSQSNINYILQDNQGYIWFATNGGLNRFDGSDFRVFKHHEYDSSSISNNIINHLYEDDQNNLWISTQNGLNIFNKSLETFKILKNGTSISSGLSSNQITCTVRDNMGIYWIGTAGGGLNKYDSKTNEFTYFRNSRTDPECISSNFITCIEKDKYGFIWVGTADDGLNMLDPQSGKFIRYIKSDTTNKHNSISNNQVKTIYEDNDGDLWIGTSAGIDLIKPKNGIRNLKSRDNIENVRNFISQPQSITTNSVLSIHQGSSGLIWFGSVDNGLGFINKNSNIAGSYTIDLNSDFSLLSNNVSAILEDRSGILWIGTNAGINMIDRQSDRFTWNKRTPGLINTLSSNNIQSIFKENSGVMWLGTYDKGLIMYDPLTEIYTNFLDNDFIIEGQSIAEKNRLMKKFDQRQTTRPPTKIHYLSNNRIYAIHRDKSKKVWIGTGGGLNILNIPTGGITKYNHNAEDESTISSNIIRCIFEDKKGRVWIGTEDAGLNLYENGTFSRYLKDENDLLSIGGNDIRSIVEDKNGFLWIATFDGGLNKFDPENKKFTRYIHQENNSNSISNNSIYSLFLDADAKLWIGTVDGLNMLNLQTNRFEQFSSDHELFSNSIYAILDDKNGNLWISTNKGISRLNKDTYVIKNYDNEDGLQSTEFNIGAAYVTNEGEMLFGGINGYCSFFPSEIVDNEYKPEILFTDFRILNEKVPIGTPGSPLQKHISETDTIILSYKDISISFEFVALNFTDSKKNTYAYKMEPFESNWNNVGNRKFANYTNLQPGNYSFKVKASNNDGIWNEEGISIFIIVKPPIWQTWWFYSLVAIFIFSSILLIIQLRTRVLHKSKISLESQVNIRTRQIETQNQILEKANKEIIYQKNEIESQNLLLTSKNVEISNAKEELNKTNEELISINSNLEDIVADRTSSLKYMNNELTNANNELDLFIYRASHDLKGPIARLLGMALLAKMDNKDDALKEYIELIERGAMDINKILNKLNNIHFINREIVSREDIDFIKIIKECRSNLLNYIDDADLMITLTVGTDFALKSDYILMKIIIENLLENAVFFKKTKKAEIAVTLKTSRKAIIISVEDNGLGILKEQHEKIFEMFYRGSERSKGNGLGLYLVRKASQKLHGKIGVESTEGKYTCFTISFPKVIVSKELESLLD